MLGFVDTELKRHSKNLEGLRDCHESVARQVGMFMVAPGPCSAEFTR